MSGAADPKNADQIAYWNGAGGQNWVKRQANQEGATQPVTSALFAKAAIRPGESVADIGCGMGETTVEAARRVGASGTVLGLDASETLLAEARKRIEPGMHLTFTQGDATTYDFPRGAFDLVMSRFGVMFFADPTSSFANIRTALKPGGRLAFACWRRGDENPWVGVPMKAVLRHAPAPPAPGPEEPGMFSFGAEARVRRILGGAGFRDVALEPVDFPFDVGRGRGLDEAAALAAMAGPASRALQGQPPAVIDAAKASIRDALAPYVKGDAITLTAAIWVVTATSP